MSSFLSAYMRCVYVCKCVCVRIRGWEWWAGGCLNIVCACVCACVVFVRMCDVGGYV